MGDKFVENFIAEINLEKKRKKQKKILRIFSILLFISICVGSFFIIFDVFADKPGM